MDVGGLLQIVGAVARRKCFASKVIQPSENEMRPAHSAVVKLPLQERLLPLSSRLAL